MHYIKLLFEFFYEKLGKTFVWLVVLMFVRGFLELLSLVSIIPFVALVMTPKIINTSKSLSYLFLHSGLASARLFSLYFGIFVLVVFVVSSLLIALIDYYFMKKACLIQHLSASELFRKVLSQRYAYFFNADTSEILKNLTTDVDVLRDNVIMAFFELMVKTITCIFILVALLIYNPFVALIVMLTFVLSYFLCFSIVKKRQTLNASKVQHNREERYFLIKDSLACIHELKIFQKESFFNDKHHKLSDEYVDLMASNIIISKLPKTLLELISFGTIVVLLLVLLALNHGTGSIIITLCLFAVAGYRIAPYLNQIYVAAVGLKFTKVVFEGLYEKIKHYSELDSLEPVEKGIVFEKYLSYCNISYTYPGTSDPVVNKSTVELKKNSTIAFIGESGSGKSTLVNLICGQLIPDEVEFRVDGRLTNFDARQVGQLFGYVPQKVSLLNGSVYSNIAFGVPVDKIDYDRVIRVAKQAAIHDVVSMMQQSYDSVVGEGGIKLSGGQRQRLGIARAMYFDPEIIIFDEATSALDYQTEDAIMKTINGLSSKKTIIIIAHRLSTIKKADQVFRVDNGIVEKINSVDLLQGIDAAV